MLPRDLGSKPGGGWQFKCVIVYLYVQEKINHNNTKKNYMFCYMDCNKRAPIAANLLISENEKIKIKLSGLVEYVSQMVTICFRAIKLSIFIMFIYDEQLITQR